MLTFLMVWGVCGLLNAIIFITIIYFKEERDIKVSDMFWVLLHIASGIAGVIVAVTMVLEDYDMVLKIKIWLDDLGVISRMESMLDKTIISHKRKDK